MQTEVQKICSHFYLTNACLYVIINQTKVRNKYSIKNLNIEIEFELYRLGRYSQMNERRIRQLERRKERRKRKILFAAVMTGVFFLGLACGRCIVSASKPQRTSYKHYKIIRIAANETLWDIANIYMSEEYGSVYEYIREVKEINSINGCNILYGQRLLVPYYSTETELPNT